MAKDKITDYSATAASNTDVGGVGIQGTNAISNVDDAAREVMSHLAETNAGTAPWADSMTIGDTADLTKELRFELSAITTGTTRVVTMPDANVTIPSGTIVTETATQTLTNKTLTAPVISPSASAGTMLTLESTEAGATVGPVLELHRNSASPAISDILGGISFMGEDSLSAKVEYSAIDSRTGDVTTATHDGGLYFSSYINAVKTLELSAFFGLVAGAATGGAKGVGTVNATEFYKQGTAIPFGKSFESAQQTITAAGSLTLAHSLGTTPKLFQAFLQNTTGELGYSIGDEVAINPATNAASGTNTGTSLVPDATNINVRFGSGGAVFVIINKTTGASANITPASWALVVRAWA